MTRTAYACQVKSGQSIRWRSEVRTYDETTKRTTRQYVAKRKTEAEALAAAEQFLATGVRPTPLRVNGVVKRKPSHKKRVPMPKPVESRMDLMKKMWAKMKDS